MALKLASLLGRYAHLAPPDQVVRTAVAATIKSMAGIDISLQKISLEAGVVYVRASPLVKNEIALKKIEILADLRRELGPNKVRDIR